MDLKYIAARLAFEKVSAEEIRSVVDALLEEGVYFQEFVAIIDVNPPTLRDILQPFKTYLKREGVQVPDKEQAVWHLIAHHVSRIASGVADPITELQELISDVYWDYDFHTPTRKYLGDSHGIEHLVGLYWEYDDLKERRGVISQKKSDAFKREIFKCSEEWMKRFANKVPQWVAEKPGPH